MARNTVLIFAKLWNIPSWAKYLAAFFAFGLLIALLKQIHGMMISLYPLEAALLFMLLAAIPVWLAAKLWRGLTTLDAIVCNLDKALRLQVFGKGASNSRRVTFADLQTPLKIVATDVLNKRMHLFSQHTTPDQPVSEAVAASIALPIIFRPFSTAGSYFFDGGIVSNLPVWAFDDERELNPGAVTIAIEIEDPPSDPIAGRRPTLFQLIRTAAFGAAMLNKRSIRDLEIVRLEAPIGLLAFDADKKTVAKLVDDAAAATQSTIIRRLFEDPSLYRNACEAVHDAFSSVVDQAAEGTVRVNIAAPFTMAEARMGYDEGITPNMLRIQYGFNMSIFADDRLTIPIDGSVTGRAFNTGESAIYEVPISPDLSLPGDQNKYRRALAWSDVKWFFVVPIDPPEGIHASRQVLTIDSDIPIDQFGLASANQSVINSLADEIRSQVYVSLGWH